MVKYSAIIFAGHSENDDVICNAEGVSRKAFVKLGDKTFIERIVRAAHKCERIDDIYITGMSEKDWKTDLPAIFRDDSGTVFTKGKNIYHEYLAKKEPPEEAAVLITCDVPLITPEILSRYVEKCENLSDGTIDGMFYYAIVQKEHMESKFPNSRRSYVEFKDNFLVCGGDVSIINIKKILPFEKLMNNLMERRKNALLQLLVLNPLLVVRFLLKRLTLDKFMYSLGKRVFKAKEGVYAIKTEDAEIAMDVDKIHQLEEVRRYYNENKELYD
jgi:spore coat polysaccharide biosynthesis protein SpsF (cytidylyltransferase family)